MLSSGAQALIVGAFCSAAAALAYLACIVLGAPAYRFMSAGEQMARAIFAQETADAAHGQWRTVTEQLREKLPKLAAMMDDVEHEVLPFMDSPKEHRVKIHSTNVLERLNKEIKRCADVVGIFPNEAAIRRLAGALLMEQSDEYAIQKSLHESGIAGDDERESTDQVTGCAGAGLR